MNKKFLLLIILLVVILSTISVGFYLSYQREVSLQPSPQENVTSQESGEVSGEVQEPEETEMAEFIPLTSPPLPPFIKSLKNANDVEIDFHYEGDYSSEYPGSERELYTFKNSNERFLLLSASKKEKGKYMYGPETYSIFTSLGSHWYGGTPIYLLNPNSKYSVSYVGFKINNRELISEIKIEFAVDYFGPDSVGYNKKPKHFFTSIFNTKTVYACGPGLYVNNVGNSDLSFIEESNGILWYRLEKPIKLYDLPLSYCDKDCSLMPSYCHNWADDPEECWDYYCCWYNASIEDFKNGNLRMNIFYKPNNKEGLLKLQVVNIVLTDTRGKYYYPVMKKNFDHYYRAYLILSPKDFPKASPEVSPEVSPKACLIKGTKVTMANGGSKNIEDIRVGDLVQSFDIKNQRYINAKVISIVKRKEFIISINNNLGVALDEPIYTANGDIKIAKELKVGDLLFNGIKIDSIRYISERAETYDLILKNSDNFFANGYLVHTPK